MTTPTCIACGIELGPHEEAQRWCLACASQRGLTRICEAQLQVVTAEDYRRWRMAPWWRWAVWLRLAIDHERCARGIA